MKRGIESVFRAEIRRYSGHLKSHPSIQPLREGFFRRVDMQVHGEAPKDFLRIYEYGRGRKSKPKSWPAHIAKVGQKYYPIESITELLLTRLGQEMNLDIASGRLMLVRGQLRYLSEYFLRRNESLVHGAEIFAGYLASDQASDLAFVKQVEADGMSNEIFTVQVVEAAMKKMYPAQAEEILKKFILLVGFDALVGNNDRHFFNWGVITHIMGKRPPRFSPIYDTARALFWNTDDHGLSKHEHPNSFSKYVHKYCIECYPKTGWDGTKGLNHFQIVQKIFQERPLYREVLSSLRDSSVAAIAEKLIEREFRGLFSPLRKRFIIYCLGERLEEYRRATTLTP